jgi:hypothetical protein
MPLTKKEAHELRIEIDRYETARLAATDAIRLNNSETHITTRLNEFLGARQRLLDQTERLTLPM